MTGNQFESAMKEAGYSQASFAREMGVHRSTIASRCAEEYKVEPFWVYALAGLIAAKSSLPVARLVERIRIES